MSTSLTDELAAHVRRVDGGNRLSPHALGWEVHEWLFNRHLVGVSRTTEVVQFVVRTNPDKRMGAGALAELIVAEFQLDEVAR